MTINAPAAVPLAMYVAVGKKQGVEPTQLRGTVQNDILKEYIVRELHLPAGAIDAADHRHVRLLEDRVPRWNTIRISGYDISEAGSTAVQEVAFTLVNAIAYVEAAQEAGLDIDDSPRRSLSFFFNAHNDFLEEIAKFRAARKLWATHHARPLRREKPEKLAAPLSHPYRRQHADRSAAGQ